MQIRTNSRARCATICAVMSAALGLLPGFAAGETLIDLSNAPTHVIAGTPFSFLVHLSDTSATKLVGYSLDLDVTPQAGADGEMHGLTDDLTGMDPAQSNFHLTDNIFEADNTGSLSSLLSVINSGSDGGIFVRGFESTLTPAGPAGSGHDVLAEVVLTTSPDARGTFQISLGNGTELVNELLESSPFSWVPPQIEVVATPEPATLALCAVAALVGLRRRRRTASDPAYTV